MGFPRKYLHESEEIVIDRKPHLWFLVKPILAVIAASALAIAAANFINPGAGDKNGWITWAGVVLVAIALLWLLEEFLRWRTINFVVTTDRLIYRSGLFSKQGKEIPLERINDISFKQSIWERLIGAGDLLIESGGEQGQQRFYNVKKPFHVQNEIYRQIERTQARDMDRMAGRRELSVPEQIEKLAELRDKGLLTPAEFDAKKLQLLDKI
jgi:uncharacterized membrane protein YdbT with pleckstrin-like domain